MRKSSRWVAVVGAVSAALLLSACGKSRPTETVESLVADPVRLKQLREQCQTERAKLGDELCGRVAEATKKRFFGDGKVPYTPPKESPKF
ncbi:MAG: EexN family lipoprotein [Hydrogenophaga sp.]|nr:EexN family lipoprotein [Hydrogenophaga sp.]